MANQHDIKKYLMEGDKPYFKQENRNGEILMLSGVWGSGKTYFWKNEIEKEIIKGIEDKSYVFISLYGKDSIEELQNEIYQLSYNFSTQESSDIISSACSVFTKVTSFMPKISVLGIEVELDKSAEKVQAEKMKEQIKSGIGKLMNGGIICFDDFERKSSKIDLNDLFGFITNLTEVFQTKTIIITNQEFFKENDSEVFSRIKEKSVNKFLLLNPTVKELFETIYDEKYKALDEYKDTILEAIKITEEKNARIFIQLLDNCLEYQALSDKKYEMFMLVLITILFVKYNVIFDIQNVELRRDNLLLPKVSDSIPEEILTKMCTTGGDNKNTFLNNLKKQLAMRENKKEIMIEEQIKYIENNEDLIYLIYKYQINSSNYFKKKDELLIRKLNNFVESGILSADDV